MSTLDATDPHIRDTLEQLSLQLKDPQQRLRLIREKGFLSSCTACARQLVHQWWEEVSPHNTMQGTHGRPQSSGLELPQAHAASRFVPPTGSNGHAPLVSLLRLLRNCVGLEPLVAGPMLQDAGLHTMLPDAVRGLASPDAVVGSEGGDNNSSLEAIALSQLIGNWASSCPEGARAVWSSCFPASFQLLLSHPSVLVSGPATMALYQCCRRDVRHSARLCSAAGRDLWVVLLDRSLDPNPVPDPDLSVCPGEGVGGVPLKMAPPQQQQQAKVAVLVDDWLPMLVGCVALRQGLLSRLVRCLEAEGPAGAERVEGADMPRISTPTDTSTSRSSWATSTFLAASSTSPGSISSPSSAASLAPVCASSVSPPPRTCGPETHSHQLSRSSRHWSRRHPLLLHLLAHELQVMREASPVGGLAPHTQGRSGGPIVAGGRLDIDLGGDLDSLDLDGLDPDPPWVRALLCAVSVMQAAAGDCASAQQSSQQQQQQQPEGHSAAGTARGHQADNGDIARHVLEAAFEVFKALLGREGQSAPLLGEDPVDRLLKPPPRVEAAGAAAAAPDPINPEPCCTTAEAAGQAGADASPSFRGVARAAALPRSGHPEPQLAAGASLVELMLVMLAALEPIQEQRARRKQKEVKQQQQQQQVQQQVRQLVQQKVQQLEEQQQDGQPEAADADGDSLKPPPTGNPGPASYLSPTLAGLAAGMPVLPPYLGYRGDVLSVLSNTMFGRPHVAERVGRLDGCVELLLSQAQMDESSPVAREWALWALRNLCGGSEEAQRRIQELEVIDPVQTPDMQRMGVKLDRDPLTGKMKLVRTAAEGSG